MPVAPSLPSALCARECQLELYGLRNGHTCLCADSFGGTGQPRTPRRPAVPEPSNELPRPFACPPHDLHGLRDLLGARPSRHAVRRRRPHASTGAPGGTAYCSASARTTATTSCGCACRLAARRCGHAISRHLRHLPIPATSPLAPPAPPAPPAPSRAISYVHASDRRLPPRSLSSLQLPDGLRLTLFSRDALRGLSVNPPELALPRRAALPCTTPRGRAGRARALRRGRGDDQTTSRLSYTTRAPSRRGRDGRARPRSAPQDACEAPSSAASRLDRGREATSGTRNLDRLRASPRARAPHPCPALLPGALTRRSARAQAATAPRRAGVGGYSSDPSVGPSAQPSAEGAGRPTTYRGEPAHLEPTLEPARLKRSLVAPSARRVRAALLDERVRPAAASSSTWLEGWGRSSTHRLRRRTRWQPAGGLNATGDLVSAHEAAPPLPMHPFPEARPTTSSTCLAARRRWRGCSQFGLRRALGVCASTAI